MQNITTRTEIIDEISATIGNGAVAGLAPANAAGFNLDNIIDAVTTFTPEAGYQLVATADEFRAAVEDNALTFFAVQAVEGEERFLIRGFEDEEIEAIDYTPVNAEEWEPDTYIAAFADAGWALDTATMTATRI